jgi:hypothetical protein
VVWDDHRLYVDLVRVILIPGFVEDNQGQKTDLSVICFKKLYGGQNNQDGGGTGPPK